MPIFDREPFMTDREAHIFKRGPGGWGSKIQTSRYSRENPWRGIPAVNMTFILLRALPETLMETSRAALNLKAKERVALPNRRVSSANKAWFKLLTPLAIHRPLISWSWYIQRIEWQREGGREGIPAWGPSRLWKILWLFHLLGGKSKALRCKTGPTL